MKRTSTLRITVNTTDAANQLRKFTTNLKHAEKQGLSLNEALGSLGKTNNLGGFNKSIGAAKTHMRDMAAYAKEAKGSLGNLAAQIANLSGANNNLATTAVRAKIEQQKLAAATSTAASAATKSAAANIKAANDAAIGQQKLAAATAKSAAASVKAANDAAIAQQKITTATTRAAAAVTAATNNAAAGQQRLAAVTAQAAQAATRAGAATVQAANSAALGQERLAQAAVRTGAAITQAANQAAVGQQRLAAATSTAAAAATRAGSASAAAANTAAVGQQKLAAATSAAAAAATRASAANTAAVTAATIGQQKLAAATSAAAAAASRATAADSAAAAAASRAAAAIHNTAAARDAARAAAIRLSVAEARAAADLARLGNAGSQANRQLGSLTNTFNSLRGAMQGGFAAVTGLAILKTADEMQSLNSQVRLNTSSEEELIGVREHLKKVADANYSDISATTDLYQKSARALSDLGKSQADAVLFTDAVSLAMRTGGRSALEQSSAIYQLSQSMGAGVLNGDEFKTITETAPLLLRLVATEMGVTTGELKKLGSEGKITSEVIFNALTKNKDELESMAAQMPVTMGQAWTTVRNQYKTFVDDMLNRTGGMSSKIASAIGGMAANFDTLAKVGLVAVGLGFLQVASKINIATAAMKLFNLVVKANPIVLAATAIIALGTAFYGLDDVLEVTGIVFGDLWDTIGTGLEMLYDLASQSEDTADIMTNANGRFHVDYRDQYDESGQRQINFFHNTVGGFAGALQAGTRFTAGVGVAFTSLYQFLAKIIDNIGKGLANGFIWAFNQIKAGINNLSQSFVSWLKNDLKFVNTLTGLINKGMELVGSDKRVNIMTSSAGESTKLAMTPYLSNGFTSYREVYQAQYDGAADGIDNYFRGVEREQVYKQRERDKPEYQLSTDPMDALKAAENLRRRALADEGKKGDKEKKAKEAKEKKGLDTSGYLEYANAGTTRNQKLNDDLAKRFSFLEEIGAKFRVTSGGQPYKGTGGKRAGSVAHDGGWAGDGRFIMNGRPLSFNNPQDLTTLKAIIETFAANGVNAVGAGYMKGGGADKNDNKGKSSELFHIGIQKSMASWGGGGTEGSAGLPWIREALKTGSARKHDSTFLGKYEADENKAVEELEKLRDDVAKDFESVPEKILRENNERVARIIKAWGDTPKAVDLVKQSTKIGERELLDYQSNLNERIDSLSTFKDTEESILTREYDKQKLELSIDPELNLAANEALLKRANDNVDEQYAYAMAKNAQAMEVVANQLYAFKKTERELLADSWDDQIVEAGFATDTIRDLRISALNEQRAYELKLFDTTQAQKLLELKQQSMSELDFIRAKYKLDSELNAMSNEDPLIKAAREESLRTGADKAGEEVRKRVGDSYGDQTNRLAGKTDAYAEVKSQYKLDNEVAAEAFKEGIIQLEEYHARMNELDANYIAQRQAVMVGGYATTFGTMAGLLKSFGQEQSTAYKLMFAAEKAFTFATVVLKGHEAVAKAAASAPFPFNIVPIGKALAETGILTAAVSAISPQGFKQGGYTGNLGVNQVAGEVHGQEYVFDAQATKRLGVDNLDAIRSGKAPMSSDVQVNIINNSSARVQASDDGRTITISDVRAEAQSAVRNGFNELRNPNSHNAKMVKSSFNTTIRR